MEIIFHKKFEKSFLQLSPKQQMKVDETVKLFRQNPHHPQLKNHLLHGSQKGNRAISAGGDLQLVFREEFNYQKVIFVRVGTHNQVY